MSAAIAGTIHMMGICTVSSSSAAAILSLRQDRSVVWLLLLLFLYIIYKALKQRNIYLQKMIRILVQGPALRPTAWLPAALKCGSWLEPMRGSF